MGPGCGALASGLGYGREKCRAKILVSEVRAFLVVAFGCVGCEAAVRQGTSSMGGLAGSLLVLSQCVNPPLVLLIPVGNWFRRLESDARPSRLGSLP